MPSADDAAFRLRTTWKTVIPGVGSFAAWRNGASTYTGRFLGGGRGLESTRATRATTFAPPLLYCHPTTLDGRYDVEFSAQ